MSKHLSLFFAFSLKGKKWREFLGESLVFGFSTILLQSSRFLVNLMIAQWLGPSVYGIWNSFVLVLTYAPVLTLGTINAMNRDVPLLAGQRNHAAAHRVISVTFFVSLVSGIIAGLVAMVIGIGRWNLPWGRPAFCLGILIPAQQIYLYLQTWLKCGIRFRAMSYQQIIYAAMYPIIILPVTALGRLEGYVLGQALIILGISGLIIIAFRAPLRMEFEAKIFSHLVKIGLPILAAGTLYSLLTSIDRWIILTYLGIESLGYYSLAIMVSSMLGLLPMVVAQQMYPRMAHRFGETNDVKALRSLVLEQAIWSISMTLPVLIVAYVGLPWVVERFLTDYQPGLKPARIVLWGLACLPLSGGVGNFLNTIGKQNYYFMIQAIGVVLNLLIGVLLVRSGMGLTGVALGSSASLVVYTLMLVGVGWWVLRNNKPYPSESCKGGGHERYNSCQ